MKFIQLSIFLIAFSCCEVGSIFGPKIAKIEIDKKDSGLSWDKKGRRRYQGKLFSGYVVQKNKKGAFK